MGNSKRGELKNCTFVILLFAQPHFHAPHFHFSFCAIHLLTHTCLCTILRQAAPLANSLIGNVMLAGNTLA